MSRFPQPSQRLQSLSVYARRMQVIGVAAVALQMYKDGKPISDVQQALKLASVR